MQITVFVEKSLIAGTKPSIDKSASVGFGIVFISAKYVGALNGNFAALIGAEVIAVRIQDADAQPGADSDGTGFAMPRRQRIGGHLVSRLGHSVSFHERYTKELLDLVNEFGRQRRAAGTDETQCGRLHRLLVGPGQQKLMHGGHTGIPSHAMFAYR